MAVLPDYMDTTIEEYIKILEERKKREMEEFVLNCEKGNPYEAIYKEIQRQVKNYRQY